MIQKISASIGQTQLTVVVEGNASRGQKITGSPGESVNFSMRGSDTPVTKILRLYQQNTNKH